MNTNINNIYTITCSADTVIDCCKYHNYVRLLRKIGVGPYALYAANGGFASKIGRKSRELWREIPADVDVKTTFELAAKIKKVRHNGNIIRVMRAYGVSDAAFEYNWEDGYGHTAIQRLFDKIRNIPYRTMKARHEMLRQLPLSIIMTL